MHWVEGADHSFHVPKSSGKTDAQVVAEIGDAAQAWVARKRQSLKAKGQVAGRSTDT
jgi:hypothetical protein